MSTYLTFIGIDKHLDPRVPELQGAKRDATALWSLFADALPDAAAILLVNEQASASAIANALRSSLGAAGPSDEVILSFAGHGTPSHRLVAFDTNADNLEDTTVGMETLAEVFHSCKASRVLCLLDCCFSGGVTTRAFEAGATPRAFGSDPLKALSGAGRIILAACSPTESAYEHPKSRHGLLTWAVIEAVTSTEEALGVNELSELVLERVQAEAARLGLLQTPQFLGHISGGLKLPVLKKDTTYFKSFPDYRGATAERKFQTLQAFGLPEDLIAAWEGLYPNGLNSLQLEAINDKRILDGDSLLVVSPTSSGKTFIGEICAAKAIIDERKAVFLFPYKALVNEKRDQFMSLYGDILGMRVIRCTGDHHDEVGEFLSGRYDLALLTYETFLALSLSSPYILKQLGLVVVDEAQFVSDPTRGISVELLMTLLITARSQGVEPQIVALSAVIGAVNAFDEWLGCSTLHSSLRPVPLIEGVIDRTGVYQFLDAQGQIQTEQMLPHHAVVQRKEKPGAQDVIVPLVSKLLANGEQIIIFRNMRGSAQGCAAYLARDLHLPEAKGVVDLLPELDQSGASRILRDCLHGGTAFHTANLSPDERRTVERAFRDQSVGVRVLAATTTVAAGINTPASTVILAEHEFLGEDGRQFTIAEYKNMAGRAGRLGYQEEGKSIIIAATPTERLQLFSRYILGATEPLKSSFDPASIHTWILRLLAQVGSIPRATVSIVLANTYGGFLLTRNNPDWASSISSRIEDILTEMLTLGLAEESDGNVHLTPLGRECGRSGLSYASTVRIIRLLKSIDPNKLSPESLLGIFQMVPESEGSHTPYMKKGQGEASRPSRAANRFGVELVRLLQTNETNANEYGKRCKRLCVIGDWIDGVPLDLIEKEYSPLSFAAIGVGDIRRFTDLARMYIGPIQKIASLIYIERDPRVEEMESLLLRLEFGLSSQMLPMLIEFPGLGRGDYLALHAVGISSKSDLYAIEETAWTVTLGENLAARLKLLDATIPV